MAADVKKHAVASSAEAATAAVQKTEGCPAGQEQPGEPVVTKTAAGLAEVPGRRPGVASMDWSLPEAKTLSWDGLWADRIGEHVKESERRAEQLRYHPNR